MNATTLIHVVRGQAARRFPRVSSCLSLSLSLSLFLGLFLSLSVSGVALGASAAKTASSPGPSGHIKRVALQVPDLERGILFFTDIIGLQLNRAFTMKPGDDPYFPRVFNLEHDRPVRVALLSTSTESRGLFLAELPEMRIPARDEPAVSLIVIEVADLEAVQQRAAEAGYETIDPQFGSAPDGTRYGEVLIVGPARHHILIFQYLKP